MEIRVAKPEKIIFVIMPFSETLTRNKEQLTSFFEDIILCTRQNDIGL